MEDREWDSEIDRTVKSAPETVARAFRMGITGKRFIDILGLEDITVCTDTDGPCERLMEAVQNVEGLKDVRSAYSTGRALLLIGATIDSIYYQDRRSVDIGRYFLVGLQNKIRSTTSKASDAWNGEKTIEFFGQYSILPDGHSLKSSNRKEWNSLRSWLLRKLPGPSNERIYYTHPSFFEICEEVVPLTTSFHVSSEHYAAVEAGNWEQIKPSAIPTAERFVIHVDGDTWLPAIDDNTSEVKTNYLYVDFLGNQALIIESMAWRGGGLPEPLLRVYGLDCDLGTGALNWRYTENVSIDGARTISPPPRRELERMFRAALGFALLLKHPAIKKNSIDNAILPSQHFAVSLPEHLSIHDAISHTIARYSRNA